VPNFEAELYQEAYSEVESLVGSARIQVRSATLLHSSSHAHLFEYDGWLLKA